VRPALAVLIGALGGALLSVAVYAVLRHAPRDRDAEKKGSRFLLGVGDFLVHWLMWALGPLERTMLRLGMTPDHMNAAGLVLGALSGLLIGLGHLELGGWAIVLSGVCDILDGRLARTRGVASAYGKFIDSTLDRFVESFAFLGFVAYYRHQPAGAFVAAAALAASLLVSYAQARGETVNVSGSGGLMQRAERLVLTAAGCLLDPVLSAALGRPEGTVLLWVLCLIAAGAFFTAIHRTIWIARRLRRGP
jgi:CDP-diacylglycerol---glycerol-3-phosphate 3-phosphatidyltransferase